MPASDHKTSTSFDVDWSPGNKIRIVTAAALFDGHDAAINVMRRILQSHGAEVIHLGHNRGAEEVVEAAIQEDANAIALSTYQGGHLEYFKYVYDLLRQKGAPHITVWGGGGGVIVPREIEELHAYGINRIFSPEDGRVMGLDGMIQSIMRGSDFSTSPSDPERKLAEMLSQTGTNDSKAALDEVGFKSTLARLITTLEQDDDRAASLRGKIEALPAPNTPTLGITGTGGAGKSSLTDELIARFGRLENPPSLAVISIDPTRRRTGGALLGDRIRMNALSKTRTFMRSMATRSSGAEVSKATKDAIALCKLAGFDLIVVETSGIGQGDAAIDELVDLKLYVMTAEYGAPSQLEKIEMLDIADFVAINKYEHSGSKDALRDVRKQLRRNQRQLVTCPDDQLPVFGTIASRFNDPGVHQLFGALCSRLSQSFGCAWGEGAGRIVPGELPAEDRQGLIPADRSHYLSEVARTVRQYKRDAEKQVGSCERRHSFETALVQAEKTQAETSVRSWLEQQRVAADSELSDHSKAALQTFKTLSAAYANDEFVFKVRGKENRVKTKFTTLSESSISRVSLPRHKSPSEYLRYMLFEAPPGYFPYTGGVFAFKRAQEDPRRMFAGEGGPKRTNERFHYLSEGEPSKRLSTAFDSVTLYGADPATRPDIYGKIGESGVSVCTLDDAKELYQGFDLCAPSTSVSMTINGPAPIVLAFYVNTAIDQQLTLAESKNGGSLTIEQSETITDQTLQTIRGTVQADILKEDQGQNTCIFSIEFAMRMMADIQAYFIQKKVRSYYSVSISGYHIAEAGANPITQLGFTLANGFTYVEYYLSRGFDIDDFAPNLSFFFSNGLDAEYTVLGRVARRIWAITMRDRYEGNARSQKLKYHIQTSGRSLHAMEIDFNDIRTTLQALFAYYDHCNSLHTNAFDEAITTPTEDSVRRAIAIQLIIMKEQGLAKNENMLQGSYIIEELTNLVEEAVLDEFLRLDERGGVLGAMERQYQRGKIQDESLKYEQLKHNGELPVIGVNTFRNPGRDGNEEAASVELTRASPEEKNAQITRLSAFQKKHREHAPGALQRLQDVALRGENIFEELLNTVRVCSLGQITDALFEVGGEYRRNL